MGEVWGWYPEGPATGLLEVSEIAEYLVALSWYDGREGTGLAGVSGISDPLEDVPYNKLLARLGGVDGKLGSE